MHHYCCMSGKQYANDHVHPALHTPLRPDNCRANTQLVPSQPEVKQCTCAGVSVVVILEFSNFNTIEKYQYWTSRLISWRKTENIECITLQVRLRNDRGHF